MKIGSSTLQGCAMAASGPALPESNIFFHFDVQHIGELEPGCAPVLGQFRCLLSPCYEKKLTLRCLNALVCHRKSFHGLLNKGKMRLPGLPHIKNWILLGKPRPHEVEVLARKKKSLRETFLHCSQPGMAELQPASLDSNIFQQFDVRQIEGVPNPVYFCLLSPCFENGVRLKTHGVWVQHRRIKHKEQDKLPTQWEIRDWVLENKPRPYDVPVKPIPKQRPKPSIIDPGIFSELDIKVTHEGKEQYLCLLHPCCHFDASFTNRAMWRAHRKAKHDHSDYKNRVFKLPSAELLSLWVEKGKPVPFRIPPKLLPTSVEVNSGARPPTEMRGVLEECSDSPGMAERNVFFEFDLRDVDGNMRFFCLLPNCMSLRTGFARRQGLMIHRRNVHSDLPQLESFPSRYVMNRWIWLGKPRPYTPLIEDTSNTLKTRTRDVVGSSSEAGPAHREKRCCSGCSDAASTEDPNYAVSGVDSNRSFWRDFLNQMNAPDNLMNSNSDGQTASSECIDPGHDDCAQDIVDKHNTDQTWEDPVHKFSAEKAEVSEKAADENVVPRLSVKHPLAAERSLDTEASLRTGIVGHSSAPEPQDFDGETHKTSSTPTAEMAEVGYEASDVQRNLVLQSSECSRESESEPVEEFFTPIELDRESESEPVEEFFTPIELDMARVFNHEPEPAVTAEAGEELPEEFVDLEYSRLWYSCEPPEQEMLTGQSQSLEENYWSQYLDSQIQVGPVQIDMTRDLNHEPEPAEPAETADVVGDEASPEFDMDLSVEDYIETEGGYLGKPSTLNDMLRAFDDGLVELLP